VLGKIYCENFKRLWGEEPKPLNIDIVIDALQKKGEKELVAAIKSIK